MIHRTWLLAGSGLSALALAGGFVFALPRPIVTAKHSGGDPGGTMIARKIAASPDHRDIFCIRILDAGGTDRVVELIHSGVNEDNFARLDECRGWASSLGATPQVQVSTGWEGKFVPSGSLTWSQVMSADDILATVSPITWDGEGK